MIAHVHGQLRRVDIKYVREEKRSAYRSGTLATLQMARCYFLMDRPIIKDGYRNSALGLEFIDDALLISTRWIEVLYIWTIIVGIRLDVGHLKGRAARNLMVESDEL